MTTASPRPAATLLLLRDSPRGMEVLMLMRHREVDFAAGALVFPGGKVTEEDRQMQAHVGGASLLQPEEIAFRAAAIRETFEEAGLLLARRPGEKELLDKGACLDIQNRFRDALLRHEITFMKLCETLGLELACDLLTPFAHWITPEISPKRFDTRFYIAPAPLGQEESCDGQELVESVFLHPLDALEDARAGRRPIIWPTRMNLAKLGKSPGVEEALAAARASPIVTVCPELAEGEKGPVLRIPKEAGYEVSEVGIEEVMGAFRG